MRFNHKELLGVSRQPSTQFEKEGILHIREKQDGLFKKCENLERWCRLRGNLFFIFRTKDPWSEPAYVVVLENYQVQIDPPTQCCVFKDNDLFAFYLVFDGGVCKSLASASDSDRLIWINAMRSASSEKLKSKLNCLLQALDQKRCGSITIKPAYVANILEIPICEISMTCDNLLCDMFGCRPTTFIVVEAFIINLKCWIQLGTTELIENSSNPLFLRTISLRASNDISHDSKLRFTASSVINKMTQITVALGSTTVLVGTLIDAKRLRLPLLSGSQSTVGFLSLSSWSLKSANRGASTENTPSKLALQNYDQVYSHRRVHSLPPRLGVTMTFPNQIELKLFYASIFTKSYRFHSGLGGDIGVQEFLAESRICFLFPCLLLDVWIQQEKELLQEVLGIGELEDPWRSRQIDLLEQHYQMLRLYTQAKKKLQSQQMSFFKPSTKKFDRLLEFAPVNLHLQRIWVYNNTINKTGIYDWITVGAFTAHLHKSKNGGLIKLLQEMKESPSRTPSNSPMMIKISMASDAIQAIKQLRQDVLEALNSLMKLAREQNCNGMLPICEDLINKSRILLSLWDSSLVDEALNFIEEHKINTISVLKDIFCSNIDKFSSRPGFLDLFQNTSNESLETPISEEVTPLTVTTMEETLNNGKETHSNEINIEPKYQANPGTKSETSRKMEGNIDLTKPDNKDTDQTVSSENHLFSDNTEVSHCYKASEEPEPLDITQLNIEASVMCLVSKVKFLCGRSGSPAIRLRNVGQHGLKLVDKRQILASGSTVDVDKKRNKFTDGLDLNNIVDWCKELRPSMKKLKQAIDGLLKTARLTHSVFRLQIDEKATQKICDIQYRRDVCFSQALTSLATALMTRLWSNTVDSLFMRLLMGLGPLVCFEGLLSYYDAEIEMWDDMSVAIEDLRTVLFIITRCPSTSGSVEHYMPKVTGSRNCLKVYLPSPDSIFSFVSSRQTVSFHVTPVFFNIGINEMATVAESMETTRIQNASNVDNFDRLNEYVLRYRKFLEKNLQIENVCEENVASMKVIFELLDDLKRSVHSGEHKNVRVLHISAEVCRLLKGLRFTSCKSAKDRTGMSVTLEQGFILLEKYHLARSEFQKALDCMRSDGCRRENVFKNTGATKYAFNSRQVLALPKLYRPPVGTFGSGET